MKNKPRCPHCGSKRTIGHGPPQDKDPRPQATVRLQPLQQVIHEGVLKKHTTVNSKV